MTTTRTSFHGGMMATALFESAQDQADQLGNTVHAINDGSCARLASPGDTAWLERFEHGKTIMGCFYPQSWGYELPHRVL